MQSAREGGGEGGVIKVWGLGFGIRGLGFGVLGLGFGVWGVWCRVSGFCVQASRFSHRRPFVGASRARSWSRLPVIGAILWALIAKS